MQKALNDGLILRSISEGHASDRECLPDFYVKVFGEAGETDAVEIGHWTRELMDGHPTTTLDDIWVVVDTAKDDQIVSALLLIPQEWRYDGIEFGVGRVEIVATETEYRRRGLVRELMHVAHERSAALGHVMQSITGISHYYRRFGYGMSLDLGARSGLNFDAIPPLKDDEKPAFTLRPATHDDIPNLVAWDETCATQNLISLPRDAVLWAHELSGRGDNVPYKLGIHVIHESATGDDVGYVALRAGRFERFFTLGAYVVGEKSSYLATFNDVIRGLKAWADAHYADKPDLRPARIAIDSGHHPVLDTMLRRVTSGVVRDSVYAWYIRTESVARFLNVIKPVLERRLSGSGANRFTGELKVAFFDLTGVVLKFEDGRITSTTDEKLAQYDWDAAFPYDMFLNVVLGRNSIAQIEPVLPEVYINQKAAVLLEVLFPVKRSWVWGLT